MNAIIHSNDLGYALVGETNNYEVAFLKTDSLCSSVCGAFPVNLQVSSVNLISGTGANQVQGRHTNSSTITYLVTDITQDTLCINQARFNSDIKSSSKFSVYPNPAKSSLSIKIEMAQSSTATMTIKNAMSLELNRKELFLIKGQNQIELDISPYQQEFIY
ncbi:MAG: hypothetical protein IPP34_13490 [Bacteroidetes bacterium]|nr:hypothetical protein [Bacteroidota bacterium]